ncbi:MAG: RnfABCDGE type electron transport complex subunit D [Clostridiales bacterium]|nr:RnfABCDGE type electron transport complex subunit D [Clostridiales bacterium]
MQRKLVVSSSPFLRNTSVSTKGIMLDVVIAMLPTALAAVWYFGKSALMLIALCVAFSVGSEWVYQKLTHHKSTISDLSAVVTGMLLAFNMPADAPWWMALVGSVIAIVLIKQFFGGLGNNFINPALGARTILMMSWVTLMTADVLPVAGQLFGLGTQALDGLAVATPLAKKPAVYTLWQLFSGNIPGMLGETCKLTLILGGIYLILRGVIDWRIPVTFIGTAFILFFAKYGVIYSVESGPNNALYQLMSGGLILGAFFMATDYVTSPITKTGRVIMGVGCALILFLVRNAGSYPEGCSFAILFMNVLTPMIDKFTTRKPFGYVKPEKPAKGDAKA